MQKIQIKMANPPILIIKSYLKSDQLVYYLIISIESLPYRYF
ncbi:MAG: hypothetical protein JWP37_4451 [Mucilaginibacter sp.]|nr:hypothetical protein [Mucilaginibacter sp.]